MRRNFNPNRIKKLYNSVSWRFLLILKPLKNTHLGKLKQAN